MADSAGSGGSVSAGGVSGGGVSVGVAESDGSGDGVSAGSLRTGADGGVSGGGVSVGVADSDGSGDGVSASSLRTDADGGVSGGGVSAGSLRTDTGARRAEQKKLAYSLVQELAGKFREENGSIVCHDLLNLRVNAAKAARDGKASGAAGASGVDVVAGTDGGVVSSAGIGVPDAAGTDVGTMSGGLAGPSAYSPEPQERNDAYYKARPCQKLVGCSARIIAEYIAKNY